MVTTTLPQPLLLEKVTENARISTLKAQHEADRSISQILQRGVTSSQGTAGGPVRQSPSEQAHTPHLEHEALKIIIIYCNMPFRKFRKTAIQALQKG